MPRDPRVPYPQPRSGIVASLPKGRGQRMASKAGSKANSGQSAAPKKSEPKQGKGKSAKAKLAQTDPSLPVRGDEKPWTTAEVAEIRQDLERDIARALADLRTPVTVLGTTRPMPGPRPMSGSKSCRWRTSPGTSSTRCVTRSRASTAAPTGSAKPAVSRSASFDFKPLRVRRYAGHAKRRPSAAERPPSLRTP